MRALWNGAVRAFIESAIIHMGMDTGMSKASLRPLAAQVQGAFIVEQSLIGHNKAHDGKSIAAGMRQGQESYELELGTPQDPNFHFMFRITVLQYKIHEVGDPNASPDKTNWRTLNHGRRAMEDYLRENIDKVQVFVRPHIKLRGRIRHA